MTNTKIDGVAGTNQRISEASDFANGLQAPELNQVEEAKIEAAMRELKASREDIELLREVFGSLLGFHLAINAADKHDDTTRYAIMHAFGFARVMARQEKDLFETIRKQNEFIQAVNELLMSGNRHAAIFANMLSTKVSGLSLYAFPAENGPGLVS